MVVVAVHVITLSIALVAVCSTKYVHTFTHHGNVLRLAMTVGNLEHSTTLGGESADTKHEQPVRRSMPFPIIHDFPRITQFQYTPLQNDRQMHVFKRTLLHPHVRLTRGSGRGNKRFQICPFLSLGGCLYSFVRSPSSRSYTPGTDTPQTELRPPRITYRARWPDYYFLGGALGRR